MLGLQQPTTRSRKLLGLWGGNAVCIGHLGTADATDMSPRCRSELRRRRLSVDGLLSDVLSTAFAELERLLLFHIITA
jgi:hypothetical protein